MHYENRFLFAIIVYSVFNFRQFIAKFRKLILIVSSIKKPKSSAKSSVLLIGMGSSFAGMILAGFLLGYLFDSLLDTKPIFIIGCGVMGFVGGLQKLHRMLAASESGDAENK